MKFSHKIAFSGICWCPILVIIGYIWIVGNSVFSLLQEDHLPYESFNDYIILFIKIIFAGVLTIVLPSIIKVWINTIKKAPID